MREIRKRDLSTAQFLRALDREGFGRPEVMGYVNLGIEGHTVHASIFNAGERRRDQLAYLRAARRRVSREYASKAVAS